MRKQYLTLLALLGLISACQGPMGPMGEMGLPGDTGPMGEPGEDGMDVDAIASLAIALAPYEQSVLNLQCSGVNPDTGTREGWACSGAKISEGRILTAAHCFESIHTEQRCAVRTARQQVGTMPTLVYTQPTIQDKAQDVAVVTEVEWTPEGDALVEIPYDSEWLATPGALVGLMSFPANLRSWVQYTFGHVVSPRVPSGSAYLDAATVDYVSAGGSSGGPVFNETAEIIGVHVLGRDDDLDLGWYNAVRIP